MSERPERSPRAVERLTRRCVVKRPGVAAQVLGHGDAVDDRLAGGRRLISDSKEHDGEAGHAGEPGVEPVYGEVGGRLPRRLSVRVVMNVAAALEISGSGE